MYPTFKLYKYAFFISISLLIFGCKGCLQTSESNIKVPLTDKEIQLEKELSSQYNSKVKLTHSISVITHPSERDEPFDVLIEDDNKDSIDPYCKKDTLFLDSISRLIALKVYPIMNHKKSYSRIYIIYAGIGECQQLISIPVKDLQKK